MSKQNQSMIMPNIELNQFKEDLEQGIFEFNVYTVNGHKVAKISEISDYIVLLVRNDQLDLYNNLVKHHLESSQNYEQLNAKKEKSVVRSAMNNWYDNNLQSWSKNTKSIISRDNLRSHLRLYKLPPKSQKDNYNQFVYDNYQYKSTIYNKYGNFEPAKINSPHVLDQDRDDVIYSLF